MEELLVRFGVTCSCHLLTKLHRPARASRQGPHEGDLSFIGRLSRHRGLHRGEAEPQLSVHFASPERPFRMSEVPRMRHRWRMTPSADIPGTYVTNAWGCESYAPARRRPDRASRRVFCRPYWDGPFGRLNAGYSVQTDQRSDLPVPMPPPVWAPE